MNKKIIYLLLGLFLLGGIIWKIQFFSSPQKIVVENNTLPSSPEIQPSPPINSEESSETEKEISPQKKSPTEKPVETVKNEEEKTQKKNKEKTKAESPSKVGLISWGFSNGRTAKIDTIIIHSVYNKLSEDQYSLDKILAIFKDYGVSPHYIIERNGKIHQLVQESNTAYHAGTGETPDGRKNINNFSIGIEVINAENDQPTTAQYQSLNSLLAQIKSRHKIKYILGHKDIAPGRKTDPWNFNWNKIGGKQP